MPNAEQINIWANVSPSFCWLDPYNIFVSVSAVCSNKDHQVHWQQYIGISLDKLFIFKDSTTLGGTLGCVHYYRDRSGLKLTNILKRHQGHKFLGEKMSWILISWSHLFKVSETFQTWYWLDFNFTCIYFFH